MKLYELCKLFTDGDWIESKDQSPEGIRLIQTGNIGEGTYLEKEGREKYISEQAFSELKCTEVFPGDVLISRLPDPVGRGCIVPQTGEKMITAVDCTICRTDENKINNEYLCYFLQSNYYYQQLDQSVTGTTRKRISRKNLGNVEVRVPSLETQREIVFKLNKITRTVRNRQKQLELFDKIIKARFVEMFGTYPANEEGWDVGTIRELVTEVRYGSSRKAADGDSGKYPYLRMNNITYGGELDLNDTKTIDIPDEELDKCTVRRGDLLFNRTNSKELVGKTCVYNRDEMMVLAGFVVRVRLNDRAFPEFVSAFLNTDFSKQMLLNMCKAAIGQANINAQELQNIGIYIPPIELQREFVSFKAQVDKSKVAAQKALDEAQLLFDSLMQKYFG